jgi:hypothetical protein
MNRREIEQALKQVQELWVEIDTKPPPLPDRREAIIKRAYSLLQNIADTFDAKRT